ncbi:MAG TPA: hypothetical protein ENK91_06300 [Bacteroidetes bacterium]|nr:hypothetical protein [Bacteroidota bacterium]
MGIKIKKVENKKDLKTFINFPHDLYKGDPNYVPMLQMAANELFSKKKNPFFEHSEVENFLAYKDGKLAGRISAIRNNNYNEYHNSNVGFWGFFDVINDFDVAKQLFDTVKQWHTTHGFEAMIGPVNFSTNDTAGLLIEGYDKPPIVEMTYNKPYYKDLIEKYGFVKDMDLFAYMINAEDVSEKSVRLAGLIKQRLEKKGITIRQINMKDFKNEVERIRDVYNKAWEKNWGFVPATKKEFEFLAEGLKMIVNPQYALVAEHEGKFVGFALTIPNINEITINFKKGKLFPFNILKLLTKKNKTKYVRIITLGVIEGYRKKGIEAVFFAEIIKSAKKNNIIGGEASWILENNEMMNMAADNLNGKKYKTYRIYRKNI